LLQQKPGSPGFCLAAPHSAAPGPTTPAVAAHFLLGSADRYRRENRRVHYPTMPDIEAQDGAALQARSAAIGSRRAVSCRSGRSRHAAPPSPVRQAAR